MLSSVPEGQPFEIDTRLLYSPQSIFHAGGPDNPGARSSIQDGGSADQQRSGGNSGVHFSLPAYRPSTDGAQPLYAGIGQAAAALSPLPGHGLRVSSSSHWRSQQHAAGPPASPQHQQQGGGSSKSVQARHTLAGSVGSHAAGQRPASAPLRGAGSSDSSAPSTGSRVRQLLLDDDVPSGSGIRRSTAADLLSRAREDRIRQLSQPRTELWQRCAQIRVAEQSAELQVGWQQCTARGYLPARLLLLQVLPAGSCHARLLPCMPACLRDMGPWHPCRSARLLPRRGGHPAGSALLLGCQWRSACSWGWRGGRRRWSGRAGRGSGSSWQIAPLRRRWVPLNSQGGYVVSLCRIGRPSSASVGTPGLDISHCLPLCCCCFGPAAGDAA